MIGISVANSDEWETTLKHFNKSHEECSKFPFGEYFKTKINDKDVVVYRCYIRKVASAASTQYMIDFFGLKKVIVIGTCAGVDTKYKQYDIVIPNLAVQYDCTVRETEPLIKEKLNVSIDLSELNFDYNTGIIGTADKPLVMWNDYLILKENNITIVDTEAAGIAYVCKMNNVGILIIKGISDFPTDESLSTKELSHEEQYNIFVKNIPIVMNKIFDDYLYKVI